MANDKTGIIKEKPSVAPAKRDLPTVKGHVLLPNQWLAFEIFALTGSIEEAARTGNVTKWTIWNWRRQEWWRELHWQFIAQHQEAFHARMAARADEIHDAYFSVMDGNERYAKMANAVIQGAKLFAEMGKDPLVNRRPQVQIQRNTQINNLKVDDERFRSWTQAQLNEYARTGEMPVGED